MARLPLSLHLSAEPQCRPIVGPETPITLQTKPNVCCAMADSARRINASLSCNDRPWLSIALWLFSGRFMSSLDCARWILDSGDDRLGRLAQLPTRFARRCQQLIL